MRIKLPKVWRREAGDTLIEVTMALSILSTVLISSTVIATQAFRTGQTARERTSIAVTAQGQMEAVRAFRDNNSWDNFLNGKSGAAPEAFNGMLMSNASTSNCRVKAPCLHMQAGSGPTYLPEGGLMNGPMATSYIEIVSTPDAGPNPDNLKVTINYGFDDLSGNKFTGHITGSFTNLRAGPPPTPVPVVLPCGGVSTDVVLVLDMSFSMTKQWQSGQTRVEQSKRLAKVFVDSVMKNNTNRLGIVEFSSDGDTVSGFTSNASSLKSDIDDMNIGSGTNYRAGMEEAVDLLDSARPNANRTIVFLSDGSDDDPSRNGPIVMQMIDDLPSNTSVYTIAVTSSDYDSSTLENMPSNGGFYSDAKSPSALERAYESISGVITCN